MYNGHVGCVDYLIKKGAGARRRSPVVRCRRRSPDAPHARTHRFECARRARLRRASLRFGASCLAWPAPLTLFAAAFFGQRRITNLLLRKGADVTAVDSVGRTPLHLAAFKGNTFGMMLFIMAKANVEATTDKGMTPLSFAAYR